MIQSAHESRARQGARELLFAYIRRLETERSGRRAVHVSLSTLPPPHRRPHHIHAATAGFASLMDVSRGQLFGLENADFVFVYEAEAQTAVETEIEMLRKLLGVTLSAKGDRIGRGLETWFDLETSYEAFVALVRGATVTEDPLSNAAWDRASTDQGSMSRKGNNGIAATPEIVSRLSKALQNADLSGLLRRQAVYALGRQMYPRPLFREFYYSIPDLGEAVLPQGNLISNTALFRHATKVLDKVMLSSLMRNNNGPPDRGVSINLNLSTVLSDDFSKFDEGMDAPGRNATIIEIQCADIVSEAKAYARARALLRERGYRICVDGVTPPALETVDQSCPGADFIKIHWDPELVDLAARARTETLLRPRGDHEPRLVITRVGTPDAVAFGQSLGIELFQGRYVDAFVKRDRRWRDLVRLNRGFQAGR